MGLESSTYCFSRGQSVWWVDDVHFWCIIIIMCGVIRWVFPNCWTISHDWTGYFTSEAIGDLAKFYMVTVEKWYTPCASQVCQQD